jgi:hypothetical protein
MNRPFEVFRAYLSPLLALAAAVSAHAVPLSLHYDQRFEQKVTFAPLTAASPVRLEGLLTDVISGGIRNEYSFLAGSSAVSLSAGWLTAPLSNRTIGVNIDIVDSSNTLVATDTFIGVVNDLARSQLTASNLTPGANYRVIFTGTAIGFGRYQIDLVDSAFAPPVAPLPPALPVADHRLFDTHIGNKTDSDPILASDQLVLDGVLSQDGGFAISNRYTFMLGTDTLSAGIVWVFGDSGEPRRTIGVNVDLLDANDIVVATDTLNGLIDGQAFSQFVASGLAPGEYSLLFTGNGVNGGGRYRIELGTSATAPDFRPIVDVPSTEIPEPGSVALLMLGTLLLGFATTSSVNRLGTTAKLASRSVPPFGVARA